MGVTNFDVIQANAVLGSQFLTQGNTWFVRPATGSDGYNGKSPKQAFKTLAHALSAATAGQNDVIFMFAESNTASATTDYQSATLNWNKDLVHLIGINSGPLLSQRSRVAFASGYATASNLFTLSANGCLIQGIEFFMGVASALPTGCFSITGQRNHIKGCHIAGFGNTANDIAGAYSLSLAGAENLFEDCTIGVDTVPCSAQINAQIYTAAGCVRNTFRNCLHLMYAAHATNHQFLRAAASTFDRWVLFDDCVFINPIDSGATSLTEAFTVVASGSPGGMVLLRGSKTGFVGAGKWNATSAVLYMVNNTVTAGSSGYGANVT